MEVSFEIKEDVRRTQTELKQAIRIHQGWVARLGEDENNVNLKQKIKEAEGRIIAVSQKQRRVVERLRKELDLYQQRLKSRNKQINIENDCKVIAQQLQEHIKQYRNKNRSVSLLKPSVLNEIHVKNENNCEKRFSDDEKKEGKENGAATVIEIEKIKRNDNHMNIIESRTNFANVLSKVKESFIDSRLKSQIESWQEKSVGAGLPPDNDSGSSKEISMDELSPTPSPPPVPKVGEPVGQEVFMRLLGLITPQQKQALVKKCNERKKRSTTSTNRNEFIYENFETKRKRYPNFPYLQSHTTPPQTRSQKLRKQKQQTSSNASREGSPSNSSGETSKVICNKTFPWAGVLPKGLTVEPIFADGKLCQHCGKTSNEKCNCSILKAQLYKEKIQERNMLKEKNIQLCEELRKLEKRANVLKESLDAHNNDKRELLNNQIQTQRNLQKLLDFVGQFKETSISIRTSSGSESSEIVNKSNED